MPDRGNAPSVLNLDEEFYKNNFYRAAIWTGESIQACLMNIGRNISTGMKSSDAGDVLFIAYEGRGRACIGARGEGQRCYDINCGDCVAIPRGVYYNIENTGHAPLRLFAIYAPAQIAYGAVDFTKESADARDSARA
jgi:mannose-6-phosphate isomerase-like protein (cupin superfamily)